MTEDKSKSNLTENIMNKIGDKKPISKQWYQITNWVRVSIVLLLSLTGGILLGYYLWELSQDLKTVSGLNFGIIALTNSFVELLGVTFAISLLLYLLYRQTDWFLVNRRWQIFISIWGVILTFSLIFLGFSMANPEVNDFLEDTKSQSNELPFRKQRAGNIMDRQRQEGYISGRIDDILMAKDLNYDYIDKNEVIIKIVNPIDSFELKMSKNIAKNYKIGDFVRVKLDPNDPKKVLEIDKIRRPPMNIIVPVSHFK